MLKKTLLSLVVLYLVVGFFVIPYVAKPKIEEALNQNLNAKCFIDSIKFNPLIFKLTLNDLSIKDKKTLKNIISFDKFLLNVDPLDLVLGTIKISNVKLLNPKIFLQIDKEKNINLLAILPKSSAKKEEKKDTDQTKIPHITLDTLEIKGGEFVFEDDTKITPYVAKFENIGLGVYDIDTKSKKLNSKVHFYTNVGLGGLVDIKSTITSLFPLKLNGDLKIKANQLYNQWKYIKDNLNLEVADGKFFLDAKYDFKQSDINQTTVTILNSYLTNLRIKPKDKSKDVLNLKKLALNNITIKPLQQYLHVKDIALYDFDIKAKRDKNGKIDWNEYIKTSFETSSQTDTNQTKSKPWNVVVDNIAINDVKADFDDEFVFPKVITKLNDFDLDIVNFELNSAKPFEASSRFVLNNNFTCNLSSMVIQKELNADVDLKCNGFDVTHYNPYINQQTKKQFKKFDVALKKAKVDFKIKANVYNDNKTIYAKLDDSSFLLYDVAIDKKSTKEKLLKFEKFAIDGINLSTKEKLVEVSGVDFEKLNIYTKRYKNNAINLLDLVVPNQTKEKKAPQKEQKPYRVKLKEFKLKKSNIYFRDNALDKPVTTKLNNLYITLNDIDSKQGSFLNYKLYTKLNNKGVIKVNGKLSHTPLKTKAKVDINKIILKDFSSYIQQQTYLSLKDGKLFLDFNLDYQKRKTKPDAMIKGNLDIKDFVLAQSIDDRYLFQFVNLNIKDFVVETNPNRAYINEVDIDGMYVDAYIDENKTLNFAKLLKPSKNELQPKENKEKSKKSFPFQVAKINIDNSNAMFADYSLPIKFKTEIHELNGNVYAISNNENEVSFIDLKGAVDKYGSMKLKGSVQSAKPKKYTDIALSFRNLDLHALSGYSAEFAGYKIDKGKLFVDLAYKIDNSQMKGDNSLIIKNIELGDEIEDENITKLPLGLAIALLEDSDGIIDINMPVEGNVDNPDFKYGKLVLKTFANLIVKAVSAPFKFLGEALGINTEKLGNIDFEAGSFDLLPSEKEKLDQIASLLLKRPKIKLEFVTTYDNKKDKFALQTKILVKKLLEQSKIKNDKDLENSLTIDLLEDLYLKNHSSDELNQIKKDIDKKYPDNKEVAKLKYRKTLIYIVISQQKVSEQMLQDLAKKRYEAIEYYLNEERNISHERFKLKEIKEFEDDEDSKMIQTKVEISV